MFFCLSLPRIRSHTKAGLEWDWSLYHSLSSAPGRGSRLNMGDQGKKVVGSVWLLMFFLLLFFTSFSTRNLMRVCEVIVAFVILFSVRGVVWWRWYFAVINGGAGGCGLVDGSIFTSTVKTVKTKWFTILLLLLHWGLLSSETILYHYPCLTVTVVIICWLSYDSRH